MVHVCKHCRIIINIFNLLISRFALDALQYDCIMRREIFLNESFDQTDILLIFLLFSALDKTRKIKNGHKCYFLCCSLHCESEQGCKKHERTLKFRGDGQINLMQIQFRLLSAYLTISCYPRCFQVSEIDPL